MREKRMHDLAVRIVDANTLHIVQPHPDGTDSIIVLSTHQAELLIQWIRDAIQAIEKEIRGDEPPF